MSRPSCPMDVMAKLLNDQEFQRFSELQQKQASFTITPEEADELRDIVARAQKKRRSYRCNAGDRELHRAVRHHARRTLLARADRRRGPHLRAITATKKERTLPPSITFNGKPYQWTKTLPDDVRGALFEAFTSGESVKRFIAMPKDTARCALTIARLERETGAVYADPHLEELAISRDQKRRGVETRCLNVATGTVHACPHRMTPAQAGVALAGDASGRSRKASPCVPQALTQPSRKLTQAPGDPHPSVPDVLTDTSRRSSPMRPGKAHRRLPQVLTSHSREGSPRVPVSAHQALPYRLTPTFPEKLTDSSRKISPLGKFEFSKVECDGKCVRTPCLKQRCGADIAASGTRLAVPDRCHLRVDISGANRRRHVRGCFARDAGSNALHS